MNKTNKISTSRHSDHIYTIKLQTEGNNFGVLKTLMVFLSIAVQVSILILSYLYFAALFSWYLMFSLLATLITCIYVLSSNYNSQAKATWILFLLISFGFGFAIFLLSDKNISFGRSQKKYSKILNETKHFKNNLSDIQNQPSQVQNCCNYLSRMGNFPASTTSKTQYFQSGTSLFDDILESLSKAKKYIFIEYFIISNGRLLNKFLDILFQKASENVAIKIIYDDMGSHHSLKRKTKKLIKKAGIELQEYNRFIPIFNIALNLRDHRKIVVVDGNIAYTGGANLADEYTNEKRMHGYWKDAGIKIQGDAVNNFTLAFLEQWKFVSKQNIEFEKYIIKNPQNQNADGVVVPFVSGPNYSHSIAQNVFVNLISGASKHLYIMTPYFVPDETITNLIISKARSGVDVRIVLPDVADKKFVHIVSRNNAEKILESGVKVYTMKNSFVHSKVICTENLCIVGSINMDLRSFHQQFESAVLTNNQATMKSILDDFDYTISKSIEITNENQKRNKRSFRTLAGLLNIISPFM